MGDVRIQLRKTSFVDYPGRISSAFFFYGCNLRCPWCHNRQLIIGGDEKKISIEAALSHLHKRKQVLGGVVLSGGEPCLCNELPDIISKIKKIGLPVKLDTNGLFPSLLEKLFCREESRPDYIALDLKIAPSRYRNLLPQSAGAPAADFRSAQNRRYGSLDPASLLSQSALLIRQAGISHEYRSLALGGSYFSESDIEELAPLADGSPWYFRPYSGGNCLDPAWDEMEKPSAGRVEELAKKARELGKAGIAKG
jgi:pyruvate formate lyase activating enzyme